MPDRQKRLLNFKATGKIAENLTIVMQLGLTMTGCIMFCFFIGLYLDKWLGTRGIFVTIFIILGVIGGANTAYRQILEIIQKDKEENQTKNDGGD